MGRGERNGAALWRRLKQQGFRGCLRVVTEWASRRRQADKAENAPGRAPAARTIARLLTDGRDRLSRSETITVAAIEGGVPLLVEAREIVAAFQAMVRKRSLDALGPWLQRAGSSFVASFATGGQGQGSGHRRDHLAMVERPNRGADHQTEARQAPDVWPREARPAPSPRHRRHVAPPSKLRQSPFSVPFDSLTRIST